MQKKKSPNKIIMRKKEREIFRNLDFFHDLLNHPTKQSNKKHKEKK